MKTTLRRILISAQLGALVATAPMASLAATDQTSTLLADFENGAGKAFDLVVLRPLGGLRVVVGMAMMVPITILYTVSLPIHTDTGIYGEAAELLITEPVNFAFRRPLGEDLSGD